MHDSCNLNMNAAFEPMKKQPQDAVLREGRSPSKKTQSFFLSIKSRIASRKDAGRKDAPAFFLGETLRGLAGPKPHAGNAFISASSAVSGLCR
jgi:hypothetical protein